MKKLIFTIGICLMGMMAQSQIRYGFAYKTPDSYNVNDPNAFLQMIVLTDKHDTLRIKVGSDIQPVDGTARNGIEYNFVGRKDTFSINTPINDTANRHKYPFNITPNSTLFGTRYFFITISNLVGVTTSDLMNGQQTLKVIIDYDGTNVGMPKLSVEQYKIYPIPVNNMLNIEGVDAKTYKIYDLTGRLVKEGEVFQNSIELNELNSGIFVLKAISDKGLIVQKFVKD